jgi:hypothetical protein
MFGGASKGSLGPLRPELSSFAMMLDMRFLLLLLMPGLSTAAGLTPTDLHTRINTAKGPFSSAHLRCLAHRM